jgi:L-aspartate oxidase
MTTSHNAFQTIINNRPQSELQKINNLNLSSVAVPEWIQPRETNADELVVISHMWEEIRRLMWNYVGIQRSTKRLERARHRLENILSEVKEYYSHLQLSSDILELRNIAIVAELTVRCALKRKESRGIHFTIDYPPLNSSLTPDTAKHQPLSPLAHPKESKDSIVIRGL